MQPAKETQKHVRINKILLGPLERPVLNWLAERMPAWVTPDKLTALGFLATILTAVSYYLTNFSPGFLWLASFGMLLNWFGDSLDGTLARFRKIERPRYGFFIDHTMDGIGEVLVFFGIGLSPYVDFRVACIALVGYMLMSNMVYITTYVNGVFRISYLGLGPTEVRLIAIIANMVVFFAGNPTVKIWLGEVTVYNIIITCIAALLYGIYMAMIFLNGPELSKMDNQARKE